jgi:hypothetical protein
MRSIAPGPDAYAWRSGTSGRVSDRRAGADGAAMRVDQSALYGVLAEIEALGLDLLEVRQLEP